MRHPAALALCLTLAAACGAHPSAPNEAIAAPVILELALDERGATLDLEIDDSERPAFAGLLAGGESARNFQERRHLLEGEDGAALVGTVERAERRARVARDAITGQPLPSGPPTPIVTAARVRFAWDAPPGQVTLIPPRHADNAFPRMGLSVRHKGVPVNDFDWFAYRETVRLDWADPWESRFRSPRFKRYYGSPAGVFLYVDDREIQVEAIVRLKVVLEWLRVGKDRAALERALVEHLSGRVRLAVDGSPVPTRPDQVQWGRLELARLERLADGVPWNADSDVIGVVLVAALASPPASVELTWGAFGPTLPAVAGNVNNAAVPVTLTPASPSLRWTRPAVDARRPTAPVPGVPAVPLPVPSLILAALAVRWGVFGRSRGKRLVAAPACLALAVLLWGVGRVEIPNPLARSAPPTPDEARAVVRDTLADVYHAFDFRGEEAVYDTLARRVSGDLLQQTYLEVRRAIDGQGQGGRARVKGLTVESVEPTPLPGGAFRARAVWSVKVSLNHWGHAHEKVARYEADLTLAPQDGVWKLVGLSMRDAGQP